MSLACASTSSIAAAGRSPAVRAARPSLVAPARGAGKAASSTSASTSGAAGAGGKKKAAAKKGGVQRSAGGGGDVPPHVADARAWIAAWQSSIGAAAPSTPKARAPARASGGGGPMAPSAVASDGTLSFTSDALTKVAYSDVKL